MEARSLFRRWVNATSLGWVLGIPVIAILALLGEAAGIGGAQGIVGVGMGASVGLLQARVMRDLLPRAAPWFWATAIGLGAPFVVFDLAKLAEREFAYSLQLSVAVGGVIAGVWQAWLLRARSMQMGWWIVASAAGWALSAGMVLVADRMFRSHAITGVPGLLLYLGLLAGGGVILGLVTAAALVRAPRGA